MCEQVGQFPDKRHLRVAACWGISFRWVFTNHFASEAMFSPLRYSTDFPSFPFAQELVTTTAVGFGLQRSMIDVPLLL
jgi:hypothetical protein